MKLYDDEELLTPEERRELQKLRSQSKFYCQSLLKDELEAFLTHQLFIRRFEKECVESYQRLCTLREELETVICDDLESRESCLAIRPHIVTHLTAALMNGLIQKEVCECLKKNNKDLFFHEIDECSQKFSWMAFDLNPYVVTDFLAEDTLARVYELLQSHVAVVPELLNNYQAVSTDKAGNESEVDRPSILHLYENYALTVKVDFSDLLEFIEYSSKHRIFLAGMYEGMVEHHMYWVFCMPASYDQWDREHRYSNLFCDLYALNVLRQKYRLVSSGNVRILDDSIDEVTINGDISKGRIHLSIPVDELPQNVDGFVAAFASKLTHKLNENGLRRYNAVEGDYWHSKFAGFEEKSNREINSEQRSTTVLLKQHDSYIKYLYGTFLFDAGLEDGKDLLQDFVMHSSLMSEVHARGRAEKLPTIIDGNLDKDFEYVTATISSVSKAQKRANLDDLYPVHLFN